MGDPTVHKESGQSRRFEFKRPGYCLELWITPDADACTASYEPASGGAPLTLDELRSCLTQLKITEGIIEDAVIDLSAAALQGNPVQDVLLALGIPMVPGEPGRIELTADCVSPALQEEQAESTGDNEALTVDFHHVQDFVNVCKSDVCIANDFDERLARLAQRFFQQVVPICCNDPFERERGDELMSWERYIAWVVNATRQIRNQALMAQL